jgi:hypothetical protein
VELFFVIVVEKRLQSLAIIDVGIAVDPGEHTVTK